VALDDLLDPPAPTSAQRSGMWAGTILDDAATLTDLVKVRLPGVDDGRHAYGPCRWMPRDTVFPSSGDACLVAFDDEGDPWIVCWTPA
jgi:hypothetical protein